MKRVSITPIVVTYINSDVDKRTACFEISVFPVSVHSVELLIHFPLSIFLFVQIVLAPSRGRNVFLVTTP